MRAGNLQLLLLLEERILTLEKEKVGVISHSFIAHELILYVSEHCRDNKVHTVTDTTFD